MTLWETLNPLAHFSVEQYESFWQGMFNTILMGFWARAFATIFLFMAFYFGVRRQRIQMGALYFFLSLVIAYGATIMNVIF